MDREGTRPEKFPRQQDTNVVVSDVNSQAENVGADRPRIAIPKYVLDQVIQEDVSQALIGSATSKEPSTNDQKNTDPDKKFTISANGQSAILTERQAIVLAIGMLNPNTELTGDDFVAKGLRFNPSTMSAKKFIDQLRAHILKLDIGVVFEERPGPKGKNRYVFHPPEGCNFEFKEYSAPLSSKRLKAQADREQAEKVLNDPRPNYLRQEPRDAELLRTVQTPWSKTRLRFVMLIVGADSVRNLKIALSQKTAHKSGKHKPTHRDAAAVVQAYYVIGLKQPPDRADESSIKLLDSVVNYVEGYVDDYLDNQGTTELEAVLSGARINKNARVITPDTGNGTIPIASALKIAIRRKMLKMLGEMDLSNLYLYQDKRFNQTISNMFGAELQKYLKK